MKEIPLTQGMVALVDDEDYAELSKHKWQAVYRQHVNAYYAARQVHRRREKQTHRVVYMHRQLTGAGRGLEVDHINRNTLDNRRCNLRPCTNQQNHCNSKVYKNNTSGYVGVSLDRKRGRWRAQIQVCGHMIALGRFDTIGEAIVARDRAARKYHGEFAHYNIGE